ncbi:DNA repair exonuclease, SbcD (plasmid) [Halapricum desulfuricans]|uniref:DNA repair exonuclease, SbcD n=1 Tax=Halapricum desulfuricans TaxID=2841257 RepID=A0A897P055_9EURY|nr:DNA repair exonuclease, SbcD [Halapricum desulfuricans]
MDGERFDEILVTVRDVKQHLNSSLGWLLTVEDTAGNEFEVKIWHTHDVDTWWREGWRYILKSGRGTRRQGGQVTLHSTKDFAVQRPEDVVDLLALGDSHIGRETRPEDTNAPYHTSRQFIATMGYAARYDVDAVIYAGDLFDDHPTTEDIQLAESGFKILAQNNIPFYFVYGNHGVTIANEFYDRIDDVEIDHLDTNGTQLNNQIALFGIDNQPEADFRTTASEVVDISGADQQILVVHNEIDPPRTESGLRLEALDPLREAEFDFILSGHLHDHESSLHSRTKIQYLGATADISTKSNADDQSAWLVRLSSETNRIERVDVT